MAIMEDFISHDGGHYRKKPLTSINNLGMAEMISEVLEWDRNSFSTRHQPSYVWWSFETDYGEFRPVIDRSTIPPEDTDDYPLLVEIENSGITEILFRNHEYRRYGEDLMIQMGISPGQRGLSRITVEYSKDYWGEYDVDISSTILYVEPASVISIPMSFRNPFDRPSMMGFEVL